MRRRWYESPVPGSISPVPATEDMTQPVGIKDGQLYTNPSTYVPAGAENNGKIMKVVDGEWKVADNWDNDLNDQKIELEGDIATAKAQVISALNPIRGSLILPAAGWQNGVQSTVISGLNDNCDIDIKAASRDDQVRLSNADMWVRQVGDTLYWSAINVPADNIALTYRITKVVV